MSQQDMDRPDGVFAAALGYQLASEDIDLLLWLHAEAVHLNQWYLKTGELQQRWLDETMQERDDARAALARAEASRRDWAAEADRLQHVLEDLVEAFHERAQRRAEVDGGDSPQCDGDCGNGDCHTTSAVASWQMAAASVRLRLTTDPSLPQFAVHPEADRAGEVDRG